MTLKNKGKKGKRNPLARKNLDKEIMRVIKRHEKLVVETKFCDASITPTFPNSLGYEGAVYPLTLPVLGTDDNQRSGDDIFLKSLHLNFIVQGLPNTTNVTRLIVFVWHPDNYVDYPVAATLMDTLGSMLATSSAPFQLEHPPNGVLRNKYTVLYDKTINWSYYGNPSGRIVHKVRKTLNRRLTFRENSNVYGTNHLYMYYVSDRVYTSQDQPKILQRIEFTDQ